VVNDAMADPVAQSAGAVRRILLVRHGESTANVAAGRAERAGLETIAVEGRDADVRLTELGRRQAATVADALRAQLEGRPLSDARVWSSPYRRAIETARIATGVAVDVDAPHGDDDGFLLDERLRDRELGILDTLTTLGVETRLPAEAARRRWLGKFYYRPPGGEAWTDVALRIRSFLRDAVPAESDSAGSQPTGASPLIVFTHDAVVSAFAYVLLRLDETRLNSFLSERVVGNASITSFVSDAAGEWRLESFGDASHVEAAGVAATEHAGTEHDAS
jgi:broad specificity phosphatase PhoE